MRAPARHRVRANFRTELTISGWLDGVDELVPRLLELLDALALEDHEHVVEAPRVGAHCVEKAASKDAVGASKARRLTNSSASGAPARRSIPASSHSTEMGPS